MKTSEVLHTAADLTEERGTETQISPESDSAGQRLRTASEVIEVLRAAAVIESAREDAAVLAEVGR